MILSSHAKERLKERYHENDFQPNIEHTKFLKSLRGQATLCEYDSKFFVYKKGTILTMLSLEQVKHYFI